MGNPDLFFDHTIFLLNEFKENEISNNFTNIKERYESKILTILEEVKREKCFSAKAHDKVNTHKEICTDEEDNKSGTDGRSGVGGRSGTGEDATTAKGTDSADEGEKLDHINNRDVDNNNEKFIYKRKAYDDDDHTTLHEEESKQTLKKKRKTAVKNSLNELKESSTFMFPFSAASQECSNNKSSTINSSNNNIINSSAGSISFNEFIKVDDDLKFLNTKDFFFNILIKEQCDMRNMFSTLMDEIKSKKYMNIHKKVYIESFRRNLSLIQGNKVYGNSGNSTVDTNCTDSDTECTNYSNYLSLMKYYFDKLKNNFSLFYFDLLLSILKGVISVDSGINFIVHDLSNIHKRGLQKLFDILLEKEKKNEKVSKQSKEEISVYPRTVGYLPYVKEVPFKENLNLSHKGDIDLLFKENVNLPFKEIILNSLDYLIEIIDNVKEHNMQLYVKYKEIISKCIICLEKNNFITYKEATTYIECKNFDKLNIFNKELNKLVTKMKTKNMYSISVYNLLRENVNGYSKIIFLLEKFFSPRKVGSCVNLTGNNATISGTNHGSNIGTNNNSSINSGNKKKKKDCLRIKKKKVIQRMFSIYKKHKKYKIHSAVITNHNEQTILHCTDSKNCSNYYWTNEDSSCSHTSSFSGPSFSSLASISSGLRRNKISKNKNISNSTHELAVRSDHIYNNETNNNIDNIDSCTIRRKTRGGGRVKIKSSKNVRTNKNKIQFNIPKVKERNGEADSFVPDPQSDTEMNSTKIGSTNMSNRKRDSKKYIKMIKKKWKRHLNCYYCNDLIKLKKNIFTIAGLHNLCPRRILSILLFYYEQNVNSERQLLPLFYLYSKEIITDVILLELKVKNYYLKEVEKEELHKLKIMNKHDSIEKNDDTSSSDFCTSFFLNTNHFFTPNYFKMCSILILNDLLNINSFYASMLPNDHLLKNAFTELYKKFYDDYENSHSEKINPFFYFYIPCNINNLYTLYAKVNKCMAGSGICDKSRGNHSEYNSTTPNSNVNSTGGKSAEVSIEKSAENNNIVNNSPIGNTAINSTTLYNSTSNNSAVSNGTVNNPSRSGNRINLSDEKVNINEISNMKNSMYEGSTSNNNDNYNNSSINRNGSRNNNNNSNNSGRIDSHVSGSGGGSYAKYTSLNKCKILGKILEECNPFHVLDHIINFLLNTKNQDLKKKYEHMVDLNNKDALEYYLLDMLNNKTNGNENFIENFIEREIKVRTDLSSSPYCSNINPYNYLFLEDDHYFLILCRIFFMNNPKFLFLSSLIDLNAWTCVQTISHHMATYTCNPFLNYFVNSSLSRLIDHTISSFERVYVGGGLHKSSTGERKKDTKQNHMDLKNSQNKTNEMQSDSIEPLIHNGATIPNRERQTMRGEEKEEKQEEDVGACFFCNININAHKLCGYECIKVINRNKTYLQNLFKNETKIEMKKKKIKQVMKQLKRYNITQNVEEKIQFYEDFTKIKSAFITKKLKNSPILKKCNSWILECLLLCSDAPSSDDSSVVSYDDINDNIEKGGGGDRKHLINNSSQVDNVTNDEKLQINFESFLNYFSSNRENNNYIKKVRTIEEFFEKIFHFLKYLGYFGYIYKSFLRKILNIVLVYVKRIRKGTNEFHKNFDKLFIKFFFFCLVNDDEDNNKNVIADDLWNILNLIPVSKRYKIYFNFFNKLEKYKKSVSKLKNVAAYRNEEIIKREDKNEQNKEKNNGRNSDRRNDKNEKNDNQDSVGEKKTSANTITSDKKCLSSGTLIKEQVHNNSSKNYPHVTTSKYITQNGCSAILLSNMNFELIKNKLRKIIKRITSDILKDRYNNKVQNMLMQFTKLINRNPFISADVILQQCELFDNNMIITLSESIKNIHNFSSDIFLYKIVERQQLLNVQNYQLSKQYSMNSSDLFDDSIFKPKKLINLSLVSAKFLSKHPYTDFYPLIISILKRIFSEFHTSDELFLRDRTTGCLLSCSPTTTTNMCVNIATTDYRMNTIYDDFNSQQISTSTRNKSITFNNEEKTEKNAVQGEGEGNCTEKMGAHRQSGENCKDNAAHEVNKEEVEMYNDKGKNDSYTRPSNSYPSNSYSSNDYQANGYLPHNNTNEFKVTILKALNKTYPDVMSGYIFDLDYIEKLIEIYGGTNASVNVQELNDDQLNAQCGMKILKEEIMILEDDLNLKINNIEYEHLEKIELEEDKLRKSCAENAFKTLSNPNIIYLIFFILSKLKHEYLFDSKTNNLRNLSSLVDKIHGVLLQFIDFLQSNSDPYIYLALIPSINEIFQFFDISQSFHIIRFSFPFFHKKEKGREEQFVNNSLSDKTNKQTIKFSNSDKGINSTNKYSSFSRKDISASKSQEKGNIDKMAQGRSENSKEKRNRGVEGAEEDNDEDNNNFHSSNSNEDIVKQKKKKKKNEHEYEYEHERNYEYEYDPNFDRTNELKWRKLLMPIIQKYINIENLNGINIDFYLAYWRLSITDIYVPHKQYLNVLEKYDLYIKKLEKFAEENKKNDEYKWIFKKIKKLRLKRTNMKNEYDYHISHTQNIKKILSHVVEHWVNPKEMDLSTFTAFVKCLIAPRILNSEKDSLFCSKFIQVLLEFHTPLFNFCALVYVLTKMLIPLINTCTEKEALNIGIFFNDLFTYLYALCDDVKHFNSISDKNPCFSYTLNFQSKGTIDHTCIIEKVFKWEKILLSLLFENNNYEKSWINSKSVVIFLFRFLNCFPYTSKIKSSIKKHLQNLQNFAQNQGWKDIVISINSLKTMMERNKKPVINEKKGEAEVKNNENKASSFKANAPVVSTDSNVTMNPFNTSNPVHMNSKTPFVPISKNIYNPNMFPVVQNSANIHSKTYMKDSNYNKIPPPQEPNKIMPIAARNTHIVNSTKDSNSKRRDVFNTNMRKSIDSLPNSQNTFVQMNDKNMISKKLRMNNRNFKNDNLNYTIPQNFVNVPSYIPPPFNDISQNKVFPYINNHMKNNRTSNNFYRR
ncbi:THO complex subunit 2 [Plasmodium brasilianum]|uniref:THO complex subunit 2 n=1 Tax=Plasmodium brasilianum TaxID=5824 RepID=A0ACB9Y4J3_PLABR|nr:THO complex subunit 2 [Plasmodium brasilianum]